MSTRALTLGVVGTSYKENEYRLPIHPDHLPRLNPTLRGRIFLEVGYGRRFGQDPGTLTRYAAGTRTREALFAECDIILLPKPTEADYPLFRRGQVLWGWPHCVQGTAITQVGIDKRMTMIAWEAMYSWKGEAVADVHTFYKNNELAGYCSVLHAMQLRGITGHYGTPRRAAVISFGATARGAIYALRGLGYHDIIVYSRRPPHAIQNAIPGVHYRQIVVDEWGRVKVQRPMEAWIPLTQELMAYDILVNCILQDTDQPLMFIQGAELAGFKPGTLIVDVSCDLGMGFDFARPTSFEEPSFVVGNGVTYYAVDHTPSYLWSAATYEISAALLPFIDLVMAGPEAWETDPTIRKAIEIQDGVIQNPKILSFQNRSEKYPHAIQNG